MTLSFSFPPSLPFLFREELRLISSLPLYLSKALLEHLFHHPQRALGWGSVSAGRGDSAVRSGFQPNLAPTAALRGRKQPVCANTARGDGSCSSHSICLLCQLCVCPPSTIPSSQQQSDLSLQLGIPHCLFPVSQLAWHLCLSADLSSSRGQHHFGRPLREDGTVAFIHFILKDDVMKWGCPVHCFVTPKPSLRLVWLCAVGWDQRDWEQTGCAGAGCSEMSPPLLWTHCMRL